MSETILALLNRIAAAGVIDTQRDFSTLQIVVEHGADPSISMPKDAAKLSSSEIQTIGEWINQGAKNN